jgi:ABC-2 type transport system permease protein
VIVFTVLTRLLAFVGKEIVEVVRRPGVLVSLVLGPFLILLVFGTGYAGVRKPFLTELVVPTNSGLPTDPSAYQSRVSAWITLTGVTSDADAATAELRAQKVDLVVIAPDDFAARFKAGQQSQIVVRYNLIDPIAASYANFVGQQIATEVNRQVIERAAQQGETYALAAGAEQASHIPPAVIAEPTTADAQNLAPDEPSIVAYFGPAALALILQHMAISLVALSLVRERTAGRLELFRVAPVSAFEILAGKFLAYGILTAAVGAISLGLLVGLLHIPMYASPALIAAVLAALLAASLSMGLFIAVVSDSERQAVQLALLLLLASVFFSGFVLAVDQFLPFAQALAYLLPVTHGVRLLQDLMLRGATTAWWELGALVALWLALFVLAWVGFRRMLRTG